MKVVRLGDSEVVVGLDWVSARSPDSGISEKKAVSSFISANKNAKRGVILSYNDYTIIGQAGKGDKNSKQPSAAALFAMANQRQSDGAPDGTGEEHNWIIAQKISGEGDYNALYWLGVVKNGLPVPGADLVLEKDRIIDEIVEMLSTLSGATVFTTDRDIRYQVLGQVSVVEQDFDDVIREVWEERDKVKVKLFSTAGIIAATAIGVTVLAVGGYFGYTMWSTAIAEKRAAEKAQREAQELQRKVEEETNQYEQEVRTALLNGLEEGIREVNEALSSTNPMDVINVWRNILYNVDLYQSSWNLSKVFCELDANIPICTINLSRGSLGTNRALLEDRPDAQIEGDEAFYTIRGSEIQIRDVSLPYLTSSVTFSKGLVSDLQMLRVNGFSHNVLSSKEIIKNVALPEPTPLVSLPSIENSEDGVSGPQLNADIKLGIAKGEISIQGNDIWEISGASKFLDLQNVRATSLEVTVPNGGMGGESMIWNLNIDYMVRTLPSPIIPEIPLEDRVIKVEVPEEYKSKIPVTGGMEETSGQGVNLNAPNNQEKNPSMEVQMDETF